MYRIVISRFVVSFAIMNLCLALAESVGKTTDEKTGWAILGMLLIVSAWVIDEITRKQERSFSVQNIVGEIVLEWSCVMYCFGTFTAFALFLILLSKFKVIAICTSLLLLSLAAFLRLSKGTKLQTS